LSKKRVRGLHASWLLASPFALLLLALAVGSATAHHQQGQLSDPSVSPRQVDAGGTVTVAVTFTDDIGAAPNAVTVVVDRTASPMTAGSDSFKTGVRYQATVAPSAGWHAISFSATDAAGGKETVCAGYVQVEGSDTPEPSADPTAAPTRSPTSEPTGTSTPALTPVIGDGGNGGRGKSGSGDGGGGATPAPGGGGATPAPGGGSPVPGGTSAPPSGASPDPTSTGQTGPGAATTSGPSAGGQGNEEPASSAAPSADPSAGAAQTIDRSTGSGAASNGAGGAVDESQGPIVGVDEQARIDLLARYHASLPTLLVELLPTIATATTGGAAWAAFVIFGKRRRDGDDNEPDSRLAAAAATGVDTGAAQGLRVVDESQLPRWRRPSLQQVRRTDPLRVVAEAPTMSFARAGVRPLESYERRQIRYRLVRLLDCPDEVRASEIGILDRGDEVQLLERRGVYWRVLCPDGRTGWVHRMTLSAPASEYASEVVTVVEPVCEPGLDPVEPVNETVEDPVETAVAGPAENVDGLLAAYMRARSDVLRLAGELEAVGFEAAPDVDEPVEPLEATAVEPTRAVEPEPAVGPSVAALARDYLERAGFAIEGPDPAAPPAVERSVEVVTESAVGASAETAIEPVAEPQVDSAAATAPVGQPSSDAAPAAGQERADGRYSGHKTGGSRRASAASRLGTRLHRPSR
jgi:hypothetical protein